MEFRSDPPPAFSTLGVFRVGGTACARERKVLPVSFASHSTRFATGILTAIHLRRATKAGEANDILFRNSMSAIGNLPDTRGSSPPVASTLIARAG